MRNVVSLHKLDAPFAAVARDAFAHALARIGKVVDARNTIPILCGFLRLAKGDYIRITSSDKGDRATIYCGGSEMEAPVLDPADWPEAIAFPKKGFSSFDISPSSFRCGIDSVLPAVSTEATRFYLNGAHFERLENENVIRLVATDGHRLHMRDMHAEGRSKFAGTGIMPAFLLGVLKACVEQKSYGEYLRVSATAEERLIRFQLTDMMITAKLIDGTFPDYHRVMPGVPTTTAKVKADDVTRFLKGVTDTTSVKLTFEDGACLLEVRSPEDQTVRRTQIDAEIEGEPLEIGFNRAYLGQVIDEASPSGGKVTFGMRTAGDPMLVTGTERFFRGVLMPMRV